MKPTVKDIAAAAGVSPGTVSNALNGRKGVSAQVRETVLRIAHQSGYLKDVPPPVSKVVRFVLFKRHGHVVSETPFFASLIEGIERECRRNDLELRLTHLNLEEPDHGELLEALRSEPAAGLLVLATEMREGDPKLFEGLEMPMVLLDNRFHDNPCDAVLIDNVGAAWKAVRLLISLGHQRIGHLSGSFEIGNFKERGRGCREALSESGLFLKKQDVFALDPSVEGAYREMKKELEDRWSDLDGWNLPTAFFADNDIIAAGAMRAMQERGIRIPEDVSIVGFDDMPFCEVTTPRLTTVRVYKQEMGALAVRRLVDKQEVRLQRTEANVRLITEVQTEMVLRDSHRPLVHTQLEQMATEQTGG